MGHPADSPPYFLYTAGTYAALVTRGQTLDLKIAPSVTKFPRNVARSALDKPIGERTKLFHFDPFLITEVRTVCRSRMVSRSIMDCF